MGWRGEMSLHTKIPIDIFTEWGGLKAKGGGSLQENKYEPIFLLETSTDLQTIRKKYFVWLLRITACLVTIQYSGFQLRLKTVK